MYVEFHFWRTPHPCSHLLLPVSFYILCARVAKKHTLRDRQKSIAPALYRHGDRACTMPATLVAWHGDGGMMGEFSCPFCFGGAKLRRFSEFFTFILKQKMFKYSLSAVLCSLDAVVCRADMTTRIWNLPCMVMFFLPPLAGYPCAHRPYSDASAEGENAGFRANR